MRLFVLVCAFAVVASVSTAGAQTLSDKHISISALAMETVAADALAAVPAGAAETPAIPVLAAAPAPGGSRAIPMLYAGMIALQAMDLVSTHKALSVPGAYETNPVFGSAGSLPVQI